MAIAPPTPDNPPSPRPGVWRRGLSLVGGAWGKARRSPRRAAGLALVLLALAAGGLAWFWPEGGHEGGAEAHWRQARQALAARDFARARGHLGHCLEAWPLNAEAHFELARACRRADDLAGWRDQLRRAAVLEWPAEEVELERLLGRAQAGDAWQVEPAVRDYVTASRPEEVLVLEALVKGFLKTFSLNEAVALTDLWLKKHPGDWEAHLLRGQAYQAARIPAKAIPEFRRALEIRPDEPKAHFLLAADLAIGGQYREARDHFQTYLSRDPDNPGALVGLANCEFSLGHREEARAALDRLFARDRHNPAGFLLRAKLALSEDAPHEALAWLRKAEARAPFETDISQTLAAALRQLGRRAEADRYERRVKEVYRKNQRLYDVRKKLLKDPRNVALRYEGGVLLRDLGREDEAFEWFGDLLRFDPAYPPAHHALADYFGKKGNQALAAYHRRLAERGRSGGGKPARD